MLTPDDIFGLKNKLLVMRARLKGDVKTMTSIALNVDRESHNDHGTMPIHMAERGSENFEQEFTLSLMESESELLSQVDDALERIEQSTYGNCEDCEKAIPKARLNAIPYTHLCVKCASEAEQNRRH